MSKAKAPITFAPVGTPVVHRWNGEARIHPGLRRKILTVIDEMASLKDGTACVMMVVAGYRTQEEQDYIYAQGRTRPGSIVTYLRTSVHQTGLAVDCCFVYLDKNGKAQPTWEEPFKGAWDEFGRRSEHKGFTWGGSFSFGDTPHNQIISVAEQTPAFKIRAKLGTGDDPHDLQIFWASCERAKLFPSDI